MEPLMLVTPSLEGKEMAMDYLQEHLRHGESELHGGALLGSIPYEEWLRLNEDNRQKETARPQWVAASTFFVVRQSDQRMVGMVDIRHALNEFLSSFGGHIGYGVRPSERKKGYAVRILRMALAFAKTIPLDRVMLACYKENEASRKTIVACGGSLERELMHTDGLVVQIYWIPI